MMDYDKGYRQATKRDKHRQPKKRQGQGLRNLIGDI